MIILVLEQCPLACCNSSVCFQICLLSFTFVLGYLVISKDIAELYSAWCFNANNIDCVVKLLQKIQFKFMTSFVFQVW